MAAVPSTATISCFSAIVIPANQGEPVGRRGGKNSKAGGEGVRELVRGNFGAHTDSEFGGCSGLDLETEPRRRVSC